MALCVNASVIVILIRWGQELGTLPDILLLSPPCRILVLRYPYR